MQSRLKYDGLMTALVTRAQFIRYIVDIAIFSKNNEVQKRQAI